MRENAIAVLVAISAFVLSMLIASYSRQRLTELDVASGRRDRMALIDDYGSNRGWYWPWTPIYALSMLLNVVSGLYLFIGLLFAIRVF